MVCLCVKPKCDVISQGEELLFDDIYYDWYNNLPSKCCKRSKLINNPLIFYIKSVLTKYKSSTSPMNEK